MIEFQTAPEVHSASKIDIEQLVTDKIIARIEAGGLLPWACSWDRASMDSALPFNCSTHATYSGINILILWMAAQERGYSSNGWLTFKQGVQLGGKVKSGEKGTHCVFFKPVPKHKDLPVDDEEQEFFACRKYFTLFNVEQFSGLPDALNIKQKQYDENETVSRVNAIADAYCAAQSIDVRLGGNIAYYSPVFDFVKLPVNFFSGNGFASTYLHELTHSTGHPKRLNRFEAHANDFSSHEESYAFEELVAAIAEAQFCAELGIQDQDESHCSYLSSWLTHLKNDKNYIFKAAAGASKARRYIMQYSEAMTVTIAA